MRDPGTVRNECISGCGLLGIVPGEETNQDLGVNGAHVDA